MNLNEKKYYAVLFPIYIQTRHLRNERANAGWLLRYTGHLKLALGTVAGLHVQICKIPITCKQYRNQPVQFLGRKLQFWGIELGHRHIVVAGLIKEKKLTNQ